MEVKSYTKKYTMSSNKDIYTILSMFEDITIDHTKELHIGANDMLKHQRLWVLLKMKYDIVIPWRENQTLILKTWPGQTRHLEYPRYYSLTDEYGNLYLKGSSVWGLIDSNTRILSNYDLDIHFVEDLKDPYQMRLKRIQPQNKSYGFQALKYTVLKKDLDGNKHMNNKQYGLIISKALGKANVTGLEMNYVKEAMQGETLVLYLFRQENNVQMDGYISDKNLSFSCIIKL